MINKLLYFLMTIVIQIYSQLLYFKFILFYLFLVYFLPLFILINYKNIY